jgi:hypothetical protein
VGNRERELQGFAQYREITNATADAVDEATWLAALQSELGVGTDRETAIVVYDCEDVVVSAKFKNSTDTVEIQPHWYDNDGQLLGVGEQVTLTPAAEAREAISAVNHFNAPVEFLANPGASLLRIKSITDPTTSDVKLYVGKRG